MRIPERLAPPVVGRDYTITAQLDSSDKAPSGVIAAMGGSMGGYSLYVQDGQPVFGYNYFGEELFFVRSKVPLPTGKAVLRFEFKHDGKSKGKGKGVGSLFINDKLVGQEEITRLQPYGFSINETFDIGRDAGTLVIDEYGPGSEFSGKIDKVTFKVALE